MNLIFTVVLIIFPTFREVSCTCDWPLENPTIDAEITDDCGYGGDANGSPEQGLGQKTWDECIEAAKALGANCVTMVEMQMDHQNKVWDKKLGMSVLKQLKH